MVRTIRVQKKEEKKMLKLSIELQCRKQIIRAFKTGAKLNESSRYKFELTTRCSACTHSL